MGTTNFTTRLLLLWHVITTTCMIASNSSKYYLVAATPAQTSQPAHDVLPWTSCSETEWDYLYLSPTEQARLTGGCAKMTFCKRNNKYDDYLFGYSMGTSSDCRSPGPILRMEPGKTYGVILCSGGEDHPGTNLHTHGPHISGSGNGDDITRYINKDSCGFYEYNIPSDHMGGTNWYHPHLHYHTEEQASGGAFGLLIIEDRPQDLTVDPSKGTPQERADVYDFLTDWDRELMLLAAYDVENDAWVNKNQDGNSLDYTLEAGVWYRMRILTVNPEAEPETIQVSPGCDAYALAHDGAYRFEPPKAREDRYFLTGASRLDIAIKCDGVGTHYITNTEGWDGGDDDDDDDDNIGSWGGSGWSGSPNIAVLTVVSGSGSSTTGPFLNTNGDTWKSYRPDYLQDLRSATVNNTWTVEMSDSEINSEVYDEDCALKDGGNNFQYGTIQQ